MEPLHVRSVAGRLARIGLVLIGAAAVAAALAAVIDFEGRHDSVFAESKGLDGPEIQTLENENRAYEKIAEAVPPISRPPGPRAGRRRRERSWASRSGA